MRSLTLASRADLLRQLKQHRGSADKSLAAGILGYELLLVPEDVNQLKPADVLSDDFSAGDLSADEQRATKTDPDTAERVPDERFIALRSREQYADPASLQNGLPECLQGVEPLSDDDLQPIDKGEPLLHQPLIQQSRLLPFLQRSLVYPLGERLDVARLVRKVARLEVLHRIPRKAHILPAGRVYVLLDLNKRLLPFWEDAHQLCDLLARKLGRNGLDIRVLEDDAVGGRYSDWFDEQQMVRDWLPLKSPAVVLVVSDLGGLARSVAPVRATWLAFMRQLGRKNIRPLVLTPCVAAVCADFRFHADLVAWGRSSRFKKQTICRVNPDFAANVRRVLGLLSVAVHVEPVLLRAILGCLPAHEAASDVEAAVYFHEDMVWGHTAVALKPEKREEYRALFRDEGAVIQRQVLLLIHQQHIGQFPFVWASTVINAQPLVKFSLAELPDADIEWAERLLQRFTRSFAGQTEHQGMVQFARRELQRLGTDDAGKALCQEYASTLHGLVYRDSLQAGDEIPEKYDSTIIQTAIRQLGETRIYQLIQRGEFLFIEEKPESAKGTFLQTGSIVAWFESRQSFLSYRVGGTVWKTQNLADVNTLCHITDNEEILLDTGTERLLLACFVKPSWASEIKRNYGGLQARLWFLNTTYIFHPVVGRGLSTLENLTWKPSTQKIAKPGDDSSLKPQKIIDSNNEGPDIFISYSHKDEKWKDALQKQLQVLQLHADFEVWNDRQIEMGDGWLKEIESAIAAAKVAILLVSPDFLISEFVCRQEIPKFLARRGEDGLRVIPLVVEPCPWRAVDWLASIQGATKDNQPLARHRWDSYELKHELNEVALQVFYQLQSAREEEVQRLEAEQQALVTEQQRRKEERSLSNNRMIGSGVASCEVMWDSYGLYADLSFKGITQRFRWIEPGTFTMGSPKDEPGRDNDEDQHPVTLTQGYWLADTTVTQALWEAVMGENPSHFKNNPSHPVEQVSWDDCQQFITKLNTTIPGLQAKLPTEAQWEYACRAGTNSPFFFGGKDDLTLKKVNYSGKWDEFDSSGSTKPVKSYPGNDWGLYEMHGNVWEWCQDVWQENLGTAAVIDPEGQSASERAKRVLRGGSWDDLGGGCRSAIRAGGVSDDRYDLIGVRLSLGHAELMQGAGSAESGANDTSGKGGADSAAPNRPVAEQGQVGAAMGAVGKLGESVKNLLGRFGGKK